MTHSILGDLILESSSKIVLLVLDGLGDLPHPDYGHRTPLEAARTPNFDRLARAGTPLRTLQHWMGHADSKTTQVYAHYQPSEGEADAVDRAFA